MSGTLTDQEFQLFKDLIYQQVGISLDFRELLVELRGTDFQLRGLTPELGFFGPKLYTRHALHQE